MHNQVSTKPAIQFHGLVDEGNRLLSLDLKAGRLQFIFHACLIRRLQQSWTQPPVDLHRRSNDGGSDFVRIHLARSRTMLAAYPTPNVTTVPIITHQVHGTDVPSHR